MKKLFLIFLLTFVSFGLFAETLYQNEIYRDISYDKELFMYEISNSDKEILYYEVKTVQNYYNQTIFYIRSVDKKLLTKFLNDLRRCNNRDFKIYINNYLQNNKNLTFLWDDCKIEGKYINEYFCYKLE